MKRTLFTLLICSLFSPIAWSQCGAGQSEVIVQITPDNYPGETSWELMAGGSIVATGNYLGDTICVPQNSCIQFKIMDSFGDGICCSYGNGSYNLILDGSVVATGGAFGSEETVTTNCPPGTTCEDPLTATTGSFTAPDQNTWYEFTPAATGIYSISTCNGNTCDTKIWVYDHCGGNVNETNTGTIFYDDNQGGCGEQAVVEAYFQTGITYYIRIGLDASAPCVTDPIAFEITYVGPITGCMDPSACNYNPLASVAGTCYFYPDPNCPNGPDLSIVQNDVQNSLNLRTEQATNCMVEEGCMNGYGTRTVLAFDTHIQNVGETDYYIGNPTSNPTQFSFNNCHGHAHYEGYADYILYKPNGVSIPIGHKNGFCVMDLECNNGGTAQYGCSNMGISKDCGDIYNSYLDCQWIDITDVDTGEYILAIKVNWDQSPDALGRYEMGYENNWAQVCIRITEDASGNKGYTLLADCQPYVDCAGVPYGNSLVDCEGNCGGSAMRGDVDLNQQIELNDGVTYVNGILNSSMTPSECRDISGDGAITVWDAGLAVNCALNDAPGNTVCDFPNTVTNPAQYAEIGFTEINTSMNYIDVYIRNPDCKIVGYEFNVSGVDIVDVENLVSPVNYPATPQFLPGGNKVVCLSYQDSLIPKNITPAPLVRIHYSQITDPTICVEEIVHVINNAYQPIVTNNPQACVSVAGVNELGMQEFSMYPNPASGQVKISLKVKAEENFTIVLVDALGRTVQTQRLSPGTSETSLDVSGLSNGMYRVIMTNGTVKTSKNLSILR